LGRLQPFQPRADERLIGVAHFFGLHSQAVDPLGQAIDANGFFLLKMRHQLDNRGGEDFSSSKMAIPEPACAAGVFHQAQLVQQRFIYPRLGHQTVVMFEQSFPSFRERSTNCCKDAQVAEPSNFQDQEHFQ
jgi:hypothetical protein